MIKCLKLVLANEIFQTRMLSRIGLRLIVILVWVLIKLNPTILNLQCVRAFLNIFSVRLKYFSKFKAQVIFTFFLAELDIKAKPHQTFNNRIFFLRGKIGFAERKQEGFNIKHRFFFCRSKQNNPRVIIVDSKKVVIT